MKKLWVVNQLVNESRVSPISKSGFFSEILKSESFVFESFEDARDAFRDKIKKLSLNQEVCLTTRKVGEIGLESFLEYAEGEEKKNIDAIYTLISNLITGKKYYKSVLEIEEEFDLDLKNPINMEEFQSLIYVELGLTDGGVDLSIYGDADGPINGYDPNIYINCFIMDNPDKNYYFHVFNMFGFDEYDPCKVYLNLSEVEIE